jgi:hypothetical protein
MKNINEMLSDNPLSLAGEENESNKNLSSFTDNNSNLSE